MDRVYSVEDIADSFWTENTGGLNRNSSEWLLQRFIQDDSPSASSSSPRNKVAYASSSDLSKVGEGAPASKGTLEGENPTMVAPGVSAPMDTSEYQAILKQRLDLACAAVALARASGSKSHESSPAVNGHHDTERSDLCSQSTGKGLPRSQDNRVASPVGIPSLPLIQKNQVSQVKVTTSGSSREQSDDDELEGEIEMNEKMDPADAKRMRRMLSNRESARRSRRRKQAHLSELETQVSHLRVENSSLMKRLTDINQKYSEAAVDNRILKADVETLRAKVKMAEETVKRVTGVGSGPLFQTMSGLSSASMQSSSSPSDNAADSVVLVQDEPKHFYQPIHHHVQGLNNGITDITNGCEDVHNLIGKTHRTPSLQRVASLEHLQKRIRGGASAGPPAPWEDGWDPESTNTANDIDKPSKP